MLDQSALGIISENYDENHNQTTDNKVPMQRHFANGGDVSGGHRQRKAAPHQKVKNTKMVKENKFLREVQDDLETHRGEWKSEVEKMIEGLRIERAVQENAKINGTLGRGEQAKNGFVDESSGQPVFKAFVDVSEYPPSGLSVTVDKLQNKLIVTAKKPSEPGNITRSFTQKVSLPRYSDEGRIRTKLSKEGILCIEVPLLFYFEPEKRKAKSFINQVKTGPRGGKSIEILVNVGQDVRPWELKVRVNEKGELLIHAEKEKETKSGDTVRHRELIKRYILPQHADVTRISSHLGDDGRLAVNIPLASGMDGSATF